MDSLDHIQATAQRVAGRYQIEGSLGEGGMGAVYAAVDEATGERVALKRLRSADRRSRKLFEREYRTLAGLSHPRVVSVDDYGFDHEGPYYTMEILEGGDLTHCAPMPWREACLCLRDAASILGVLHARRMVHRDLSPRNLWRTLDGRLKLLDFGALAPFGEGREVVGTPPLVAPEVLRQQEADQRSDLFSLGALAYWLLTGTHAFPARKLGELERLWNHEPVAPSRVVRTLGAMPHDVPADLDSLVLALLRLDPAERPPSTVDVIDALNALASLEPESQEVVERGYLESAAFVGRAAELEVHDRELRRAIEGRSRALLVEGPEGVGRSHLVHELAMVSRLRGAVVGRTDASASDQAYGAASVLAVSVLHAAPVVARAAAAPHAAVLAHLSPEVHAALGEVTPDPELRGAPDERVRKQRALCDWLLAVSEKRPLAVYADDMHRMDADSQALLTALAHSGEGHGLVLVATRDTDAASELSPALQSFRSTARRLRLGPLSAEETLELLQGVLGVADGSERLAAALHQRAEGNPRLCLWLLRELVRRGVVRYVEGAWVLPKAVPEVELPLGVRAGTLAGLDALSESARVLARRLSLAHQGAFAPDDAVAVLDGDEVGAQAALAELREARVLLPSARGHRFTHPSLCTAFQTELSGEAERAAAHLALARALEARADGEPLEELRACLHFLRGGDVDEGARLLASATATFSSNVREQMRDAVPLVKEAIDRLSVAGRSDRELLAPLSVMCMGAYYVDPVYVASHGDRTIAAFESALHLGLAKRLRRFVGGKLALIVALIVSGIRLRRVPNAPPMPHVVRCFLMSVSTLAGAALTSMQAGAAERYAAVLWPLRALGESHVATVSARLTEAIAATGRDTAAEPHRRTAELRDWLESDRSIKNFPDDLRYTYLASTYFMHGILSVFVDDESCLAAADFLDAVGPMFQLNGLQIRAMHAANRGDFAAADRYRERLGVLAIQVGTAWRIDTVAASITMPALWSHDAVALKRIAEQQERLVASGLAGYAYHARAARAAIQVQRGKPWDAVEALEAQPDEPLCIIGWSRTRSVLASAHNACGEHERARAVCQAALSHLSPADLEFPALNVNLEVELAIAEAGLGRHVQAAESLDALLAKHAGKGPLLRCYLHRARARVALLAGDTDVAGEHLDACDALAREITSPSLLSVIRNLRGELRKALSPEVDLERLLVDDGQLASRVRLILVGPENATAFDEGAERLVQVAAEVTRACKACFVHADTRQANVGLHGELPTADVIDWARERLALDADADLDDTTDAPDTTAPPTDTGAFSSEGISYCIKVFWAARGELSLPAGALVLGFDSETTPRLPPHDVLRVMADYVDETSLAVAEELDSQRNSLVPRRAVPPAGNAS